jgi:colanic acid biosynthesis glycosyl transferase WcaI
MTLPSNPRCRRLLVLTHLYLPDECGGAAIFADMCRGLADRGVEVTVRCAYPYYPEWRDKSGRNGVRIERTVEDGIRVERYGMFIPTNPRSIWQRVLYEGSYLLSICRSLWRGGRYDAVMAYCPLAGSVACGALHKLLYGGPFLMSVQDLPADAAAAGGIARSGPARAVLQAVQRALFNRADVWRTLSPVMAERLQDLRRRDQPILTIPNWLHATLAEEIGRLPSKVGRPASDPVRLLYSGNIGTKQGLLEFCQELHRSDAPFAFRIHGDGGAAAQMRDWVAGCGDPRFTLAPLLDEADYVRALHDADLFVITEKAGSGGAFFPGKAIPTMAVGTPILAISDPDSPLGVEMRREEPGPWFSWEDVGDVAPMLASLRSDPSRLSDWQGRASRRADYFDRERCLDMIQDVLEEMIDDRTLARTRASLAASPAT